MIARDYKLTLVGRMTNNVYIERYFATIDEAGAVYDALCQNSSGLFKSMPEDTLIVKIDELVPTSLGQAYINARVDWLFRDIEGADKKV